MERFEKNHELVTKILFLIYFGILTWIILFKMQFSIHSLPFIRNINLIPFAGTAVVNGQLDYNEIINNIIIFIPFGLYISMLRIDWSFLQKLFPIFLVSLFYESFQYFLAIGGTDITDLIGNTLGGALGIILFMLFSKVLKDKTHKVLNILALLTTIAFVILLAVLIFANM